MIEREIEAIDHRLVSGEQLRESVLTELAASSVAILSNVLTRATCADFARTVESDAEIEIEDSRELVIDSDAVQASLPGVQLLGSLLTQGLDDDDFSEKLFLRKRLKCDPGDSAEHVDGSHRASVDELYRGNSYPGFRAVYQLTGGNTRVGIVGAHFEDGQRVRNTGRMSTGDCWILPQDRFVGMPMRTRSGKVAFARHPIHYGENPTDRLLLVQDIEFSVSVALDSRHLEEHEVVSGNPPLSTMEIMRHTPNRKSELEHRLAVEAAKNRYN